MNTLTRSKRQFAVLVLALSPLVGCSTASKNLIFFTNTSFGVDVGSDPTSGAPIKAVIGFKRQEGVLNPVYDEAERTESKDELGKTTAITTKGGLRDQAYSVIAKYQGSAEASANTDMSSAQWFATGLAAEKLADAPGIAGAVTGSAKVAEAAAKERAGIFGGERLTHITQVESLHAVMEVLIDLAREDVDADALVLRVSDFAKRYNRTRVPTISTAGKTNNNYQLVVAGETVDVADPWRSISSYLGRLEGSKQKLEDAIKTDGIGVLGTDGIVVADELALRDAVVAEIAKVRLELSESTEIGDAIRYVCKKLGG